MKTQTLNLIINRTVAGHTHQVIDYRHRLITRQFCADGYFVTVDLGYEEADFNSVTDAIRWIEDEINTADQARYYRTQADLHREWAPRVL